MLLRAVGETGILEKAIGIMMGTPQGLIIAIPRMMFPVALLSAFFSNTATDAMLIPITVSFDAVFLYGAAWRLMHAPRLIPCACGARGGKVTLPRSLQSFTFGRHFNQSLDKVTLPNSLQSLAFGDLWLVSQSEYGQGHVTTQPAELRLLLYRRGQAACRLGKRLSRVHRLSTTG